MKPRGLRGIVPIKGPLGHLTGPFKQAAKLDPAGNKHNERMLRKADRVLTPAKVQAINERSKDIYVKYKKLIRAKGASPVVDSQGRTRLDHTNPRNLKSNSEDWDKLANEIGFEKDPELVEIMNKTMSSKNAMKAAEDMMLIFKKWGYGPDNPPGRMEMRRMVNSDEELRHVGRQWFQALRRNKANIDVAAYLRPVTERQDLHNHVEPMNKPLTDASYRSPRVGRRKDDDDDDQF